MITVNELRVGNNIFRIGDSQIYTISAVNLFDVELIIGDPFDENNDNDSFKESIYKLIPIRLTSYFMSKLGIDAEPKFLERFSSYSIELLDKNNNISTIQKNHQKRPQIIICSVHHIQNLHFDITGNELKLL